MLCYSFEVRWEGHLPSQRLKGGSQFPPIFFPADNSTKFASIAWKSALICRPGIRNLKNEMVS